MFTSIHRSHRVPVGPHALKSLPDRREGHITRSRVFLLPLGVQWSFTAIVVTGAPTDHTGDRRVERALNREMSFQNIQAIRGLRSGRCHSLAAREQVRMKAPRLPARRTAAGTMTKKGLPGSSLYIQHDCRRIVGLLECVNQHSPAAAPTRAHCMTGRSANAETSGDKSSVGFVELAATAPLSI
jgi:hypothetical protein